MLLWMTGGNKSDVDMSSGPSGCVCRYWLLHCHQSYIVCHHHHESLHNGRNIRNTHVELKKSQIYVYKQCIIVRTYRWNHWSVHGTVVAEWEWYTFLCLICSQKPINLKEEKYAAIKKLLWGLMKPYIFAIPNNKSTPNSLPGELHHLQARQPLPSERLKTTQRYI